MVGRAGRPPVRGRNLQAAGLHVRALAARAPPAEAAFDAPVGSTAAPRVEWLVEEGEEFQPVKKVATVHGQAHNLLLGERVALNLLARASGIAARYVGFEPFPSFGGRRLSSTTRPWVSIPNGRARRLHAIKEQAHWHGVVAGTRKTTPGTSRLPARCASTKGHTLTVAL